MENQVRSAGGALESYTAPGLTVYGTLEEITQLKPRSGEDISQGSTGNVA